MSGIGHAMTDFLKSRNEFQSRLKANPMFERILLYFLVYLPSQNRIFWLSRDLNKRRCYSFNNFDLSRK